MGLTPNSGTTKFFTSRSRRIVAMSSVRKSTGSSPICAADKGTASEKRSYIRRGFRAWSGTIGLLCNFTGGSSGGPWLGWFNGTWGYVNGVNSFGVGGLPDDIFSPYFGDNAGALYNSVANL
jgi:hypothetical protein